MFTNIRYEKSFEFIRFLNGGIAKLDDKVKVYKNVSDMANVINNPYTTPSIDANIKDLKFKNRNENATNDVIAFTFSNSKEYDVIIYQAIMEAKIDGERKIISVRETGETNLNTYKDSIKYELVKKLEGKND